MFVWTRCHGPRQHNPSIMRITASDQLSLGPGHIIRDQRLRTNTRVSSDPLGSSLSIPGIVASCAYLVSCLWRLNLYKFNTIVIKVSSPWSTVIFCVDIQGRQQKPETLTLTILMLLDIKILEDNHRLNRQHQFVIRNTESKRLLPMFFFCIELSNNLFFHFHFFAVSTECMEFFAESLTSAR